MLFLYNVSFSFWYLQQKRSTTLREQSHSDTDFYEIFEVHSESEDGAYTTASFTIKKEKDNGEYRLSSGYSDLRFYQNLEEAKSAIKDIKTRFISTLISWFTISYI